MRKLLFIFNPCAGRGDIRKHLAQIVDIFTKADFETVVYPTQCRGDATKKVIQDGCRFDRIIAAGGDGMLNELINGIEQLPCVVEVGYIPMGTANDFAVSNHIPRRVLEAAQLAVSDHVSTRDVGNFNGRDFSYVAAFGIGTNISYDTTQRFKNHFGMLAYRLSAIKKLDLPHMERFCRTLTITANGQTITDRFLYGAVSNSHSIAGMKYLAAKDVQLDNGLLDGLFIRKPKNPNQLRKLIGRLLAKDFDADCFTFLRAPEFEIEMESAPWTLDGENGGEHEKIHIFAKKQALHIALPEE